MQYQDINTDMHTDKRQIQCDTHREGSGFITVSGTHCLHVLNVHEQTKLFLILTCKCTTQMEMEMRGPRDSAEAQAVQMLPSCGYIADRLWCRA